MQPSSYVGANLGNSGSPIEFEINGKKLKVKLIDQRVKSALEQALTTKARALLNADKDYMSDAEYSLAYGSFSDKVVTGAYAFSNRLCQQWLPTVPGLSQILFHCAGVPLDSSEDMLLNFPVETGALIRIIMENSFPNLKREEKDSLPEQ